MGSPKQEKVPQISNNVHLLWII